ncbi:MAG TPA: hypothetical protein VF601_08850 [Beijerinckiaceae bacterium]|jgi:hypothetical protein
MADKSQDAKARAETKFRIADQRSQNAEAVRVETAGKARAFDEKTQRLKGLRLAKEAQDRKAAKKDDSRPKG